MNRRRLLIGISALTGSVGLGLALPDRGTRGRAATGTVTIETPTTVPTPADPTLCDNPAMRRKLIRQRIANLRAEIAQLRASLDDCD